MTNNKNSLGSEGPTDQPRPASSQRLAYQKISLYKDVPLADWEDWHWQIKNRITRLDQIAQVIKLTKEEEEGIKNAKGRLAMAVTPYWATLLDPQDPHCPIRRQCIPLSQEFVVNPQDLDDPCGEDEDSPVPHLVHRYPDRVLLLVTDSCAMYCRHCTRRRTVGQEHPVNKWGQAIEYIRSHKEIRDVLISGGDPFVLEDEVLEGLLKELRAIPHLEFLRIGTRVPVTMPQRFTPKFLAMLKKYGPLWISIHFNHPKEISQGTAEACNKLADTGFPLGSQSVLLKGINDSPDVIRQLMHGLLKIRVRPYYLYQCDLARGTHHFRTPVSTGLEIIEKLRGYTSGYAIPTYVIDAPGGGGKIPLNPNYVLSHDHGKYTLRNYENKVYTYTE
ncbi:MAG: KamA family radical SAM protein [bacterium]